VLVSEFDFHLPPELIAQEPLADRSSSRMLVLDRAAGAINDDHFRNFPARLHHGDVLVLNNSRVFPARLFGHRSGKRAQPLSPRNPASREFLKGTVEVLLTRALGNGEWEALVRPGRKLGVGELLRFGDEEREPLLEAEIVGRGEYGERRLRFSSVPNFFERVESIGHVPLPPYIARDDRAADRERYQTVFACNRGSAAAPTAGLHFTRQILDEIRSRGVEIVELTLHVGLGTFQPLREERVEANKLHVESYSISSETANTINRGLDEKRRIIAVGTTVVRTLEHAALESGSGKIRNGEGETSIFIYPGFRFRVVGALLTNFHLPRSSLLMLVSAFAGRERVLEAYRHAVEEKYRFFSYGDCMFVK